MISEQAWGDAFREGSVRWAIREWTSGRGSWRVAFILARHARCCAALALGAYKPTGCTHLYCYRPLRRDPTVRASVVASHALGRCVDVFDLALRDLVSANPWICDPT